MVRHTSLGLAKRDDPIFREGVTIYTPRTTRALGKKEAKALDDRRDLQLKLRAQAQSETPNEPPSDKELGEET